MSEEETRELVADAAAANVRLDLYLSRATGLPRSQIQRLIEAARVLVDGRTLKSSAIIRPGQRISVTIPPPQPSVLTPEPIPLDILYEDKDLLVLNKPAGLVVHPAPGHPAGTLVHALLHHCPDLPGIGAERRPGIVHRLDKDTSGVMVVAKTNAAIASLAGQFKARRVKKTYLALVQGEIRQTEGRIAAAIGRHARDRKRMAVRTRRAREALTTYRVMKRLDGRSLLQVDPETGRTHQIRVHLSAMGHPVVGDKVYGGRKERALAAGRQLLHAWKLGLFHPRTHAWMEFEAPIPADFASWLQTEASMDATGAKRIR